MTCYSKGSFFFARERNLDFFFFGLNFFIEIDLLDKISLAFSLKFGFYVRFWFLKQSHSYIIQSAT